MNKTLAIIPARYASTRFPGKPLADLGGKSMIERVYRQVASCVEVDEILVATDDVRILDAVHAFGAEAVLTSENCFSGTDRCAEVLAGNPRNWDYVINVQGDEPFIQPGQISQLIACMRETSADAATLIKKITSEEDLANPNVVKAVVSGSGRALYFSRSPIPYLRDGRDGSHISQHCFYRHLGIYAFRASVLPVLAALPPGNLEQAESLEQLRWLEAGYSIYTSVTEHASIGIDTPEDLEKAKAWLN